jgi:hypothetical protein
MHVGNQTHLRYREIYHETYDLFVLEMTFQLAFAVIKQKRVCWNCAESPRKENIDDK